MEIDKAKIFRNEILNRINYMRENFKTTSPKHLKGKRFKDNSLIYSAIIGAILSLKTKNKNNVKDILTLIQGLDCEPELVKKKKFDPLIFFLLSQSASLDYKFETDLKYH